MRPLLTRANEELLADLAWSRVLLAFDFDGTLAPLVARPGAARMRASTLRWFTRLCAVYPCAVITGRASRDVAGRLGGAAVKYVVGNHGLEPGRRLGPYARVMDAVRPRFEAALGAVQGVELEDKRYSLAIHYRRSRRKQDARAAIAAVLAALPEPMRVVPGKCVVNVVPRGAPHKGEALLRLRARARADVAVFVGDDVTDEDVFTLDQPGRLVGVRVGRSSRSAAAWYLKDQRAVDELLRRLVTLRERSGTR